MKTPMVFFIVFLGLLSCSKNKEQPGSLILNDTIDAGYGQVYTNFEHKMSIKFDSVLNDSRCPIDLECLWAGYAEVRFDFTLDNKQHILSMGRHKNDSIIGGYNIHFIELTPYPVYHRMVSLNEYKARIIITK
jgi:hypothetical protein